MSYQIRKGWPSTEALDVVAYEKTADTIKDGMFVVFSTDGAKDGFSRCEAAAHDASKLWGFVIGKENLHGTLTVLLSEFVVELKGTINGTTNKAFDTAASWTLGDAVTFDASGSVVKSSSTADMIGRVLAYDAANSILTIAVHPLNK